MLLEKQQDVPSLQGTQSLLKQEREREAGCLEIVPEILAHDAEKKVFGSTDQLLPMTTAVWYCTQ